MRNIDHLYVWCQWLALVVFPPTARYNSDEFADVLFIKQQHWGMQITERKVKKEWINQWWEEEKLPLM